MWTDELSTSSDFRFLTNYPEARVVAAALVLMNRRERRGFVRAWLSEGVPAVFRENPMVYEMLREWLARNLAMDLETRIDPKDVTLVGSARLGYSLAPYPRFGRPFGADSDLDFALISSSLFDAVAIDFQTWCKDVKQGETKPQTAKETTFWPQNMRVIEQQIRRGFIDPKKIPNRHGYRSVKRLNSTMARLLNVISAAPSAPRVRSSSVRVYRHWESFVSQVCLNLNQAIPRRGDLPRSLFGSNY
jgi:hypothetical protein